LLRLYRDAQPVKHQNTCMLTYFNSATACGNSFCFEFSVVFVLGSFKEKGKVFAQWRDTYSVGCFRHRLCRSWDIVSCLITDAVSSPTLFARCYVCWLSSAVFTS